MKEDQAKDDRYLIADLNIPVLSKDFDADESEIALGLIVTDKHQWDSNHPKWIKNDRTFSPFQVRLQT